MSTAEIIEKELGVTLPSDYVTFLEDYGVYDEDGIEIYGYDDDIIDPDQLPCVIGATKLLWQDYPQYRGTFLSLHFSGAENEQVVLNTVTGDVYMLTDEGTEKIADSFEEWFKGEILAK